MSALNCVRTDSVFLAPARPRARAKA